MSFLRNNTCHVVYHFPHVDRPPCHVSILRNGPVTVSNLGVKGPSFAPSPDSLPSALLSSEDLRTASTGIFAIFVGFFIWICQGPAVTGSWAGVGTKGRQRRGKGGRIPGAWRSKV